MSCVNQYSISLKCKCLISARWKTCFTSDENSGVSLVVKIHSPDPNGRHLLVFDCMNTSWVWEYQMKVVTYVAPTHVLGRRDHVCWYKVGSNLVSYTSNSSSCKQTTFQPHCILVFCYIGGHTAKSIVSRLFFHSKTFSLVLYTSGREFVSILEIIYNIWL